MRHESSSAVTTTLKAQTLYQCYLILITGQRLSCLFIVTPLNILSSPYLIMISITFLQNLVIQFSHIILKIVGIQYMGLNYKKPARLVQ